MTKKITKAVIPSAGLGTRLLPATRAIPKEMLPVLGKPTIQHVVEEAAKSGITNILIIVSDEKQAIRDHFSPNANLQNRLKKEGRDELLNQMSRIDQLANIQYTVQHPLKGLGDAILYARDFAADDPFVVLLGDAITTSPDGPVTGQLIDIYQQYDSSVVALEEVEQDRVSRYGVIDPESVSGRVVKIRDMVEKPRVEQAPSRLVVAGRYLFKPEIFNFLDNTPPGKNNEIQITDAMRLMLAEHSLYGCQFDGRRHDIGNVIDFISANIELGLNDPALQQEMRNMLQRFPE